MIKKPNPLLIATVVLLGFAAVAPLIGAKTSGLDTTAKPTDVSTGSFKTAGVIFPIDGVSRSGDTVSFTITENARELDKKADTVEISAMQKTGTSPSDCPLIKSTSIDKTVNNYNPISGSANISAKFASVEMATAAADADCLLIRDTE